jgi:hypothetical protein
MSIKHKANISQRIAAFDLVLSKYPQPRPFSQPSTPQFLAPPRNLDTLCPPQSSEKHCNPNSHISIKEYNIKSIDDKINNIMKKHEKKEDPSDARILELKNMYSKNAPNRPSPAFHSKKETLKKSSYPFASEFDQENTVRPADYLKGRERSLTYGEPLLEKHRDGASIKNERRVSNDEKKYDSEIAKLNERIKMAEEQKKKLNIEFSPFSKASMKEQKGSSINESILSKLSSSNNSKHYRSTFEHNFGKGDNAKLSDMAVDTKGSIRHQRNIKRSLNNIQVEQPVRTAAFPSPGLHLAS